MFQKQKLLIENDLIDSNTIKMLKRGNRYKLFKLKITLPTYDLDRLQIFYQMLEEMPELEICNIKILDYNNDIVNTLFEKSNFKNKQDLFRVIDEDVCPINKNPEPYEYVSKVSSPEYYDMS